MAVRCKRYSASENFPWEEACASEKRGALLFGFRVARSMGKRPASVQHSSSELGSFHLRRVICPGGKNLPFTKRAEGRSQEDGAVVRPYYYVCAPFIPDDHGRRD